MTYTFGVVVPGSRTMYLGGTRISAQYRGGKILAAIGAYMKQMIQANYTNVLSITSLTLGNVARDARLEKRGPTDVIAEVEDEWVSSFNDDVMIYYSTHNT